MTLPKNLTKWINTKLGYVSKPAQVNIQTQSGVNLLTQSGVNLITQPNVVTPTPAVSWTYTKPPKTTWQSGYIVNVGTLNITDNLGNLLVDNLGNYIVTNTTYTTPKPLSSWTPTGAR